MRPFHHNHRLNKDEIQFIKLLIESKHFTATRTKLEKCNIKGNNYSNLMQRKLVEKIHDNTYTNKFNNKRKGVPSYRLKITGEPPLELYTYLINKVVSEALDIKEWKPLLFKFSAALATIFCEITKTKDWEKGYARVIGEGAVDYTEHDLFYIKEAYESKPAYLWRELSTRYFFFPSRLYFLSLERKYVDDDELIADIEKRIKKHYSRKFKFYGFNPSCPHNHITKDDGQYYYDHLIMCRYKRLTEWFDEEVWERLFDYYLIKFIQLHNVSYFFAKQLFYVTSILDDNTERRAADQKEEELEEAEYKEPTTEDFKKMIIEDNKLIEQENKKFIKHSEERGYDKLLDDLNND